MDLSSTVNSIKKWSIQTLYKLKSHNNNIDEVNLFSKGNKLHIFFYVL